jgi:hypothetical protein
VVAETEQLFGRAATHFTLRFVLAPVTTVDGQVVLELADLFLAQLLFPGSPPVSLWTKAPGMKAKLAMADFSDRAWGAARKRIAANATSVLRLEARTADFPKQTIALNVHANPPGVGENFGAGTIELSCSVPYLRHLAVSTEKTAALIDFGKRAWNGAMPVYGFGNVAGQPPLMGPGSFAMGGPPKLAAVAPPADRVHDIPVAQVGSDVDGNIDGLIAGGRGIKGAYWANFLSAQYVKRAGGEAELSKALSGLRNESLGEGMLIVTTDAPLPQDSEDNRARFRRVESALKPAFLSRAETPANKRDLLGEFFRE